MENASKALLIAGAILIVIILIGIGVAVINSTSNIQDQAGSTADSMAAQTFNSRFTAYEGKGISASQVKSLISLVNSTKDRKVTLNNGTNGITSTGSVSSAEKYDVYVEYDGDGYIDLVTIVKTGATKPNRPGSGT